MYYWRDHLRGGHRVDIAFTAAATRLGRSSSAFADFNLGTHVGDDPAAVAANRSLLAADLGVLPDRVLVLDQVHGSRVVVIGPADDVPTGAMRGDAMVTARSDVALLVLVADCVPVLLADPLAGVVGVAHAGRAGLVAGVVPAAVDAAVALGAGGLRAIIGPSICGGCYEVPAALRDEVAACAPAAAARTTWGTPGLDIAAGVRAQLAALGVPVVQVPGCTRETPTLYSYRRAGAQAATGRFAGVIRLHPRQTPAPADGGTPTPRRHIDTAPAPGRLNP